MKKMLKRGISIMLALALCFTAMQITSLANTATKAEFQSLSEWVQMADDLLNRGKVYSSGKTEFDAAYNAAKNLLEAETASDEEITACIETLKTTWAGLKIETVTEIAPDGGRPNDDTDYANFGSSYNTASGKQPKIYYNINATGADFWSDIEMVYLYAYGYQTDTVTENLISGTTLPIGGTNASQNGIRLCTTDYVYNAFASSTEGWVNRGSIKKIEFSKAKLSNFINLGKLSQIMFCYQNDNNPDATLCAGSLFIVRSTYEKVPVSYELYKWINRAENLLAQDKTYVSGLGEFTVAVEAMYNADSTSNEDDLIDDLITAWNNLAYKETVVLGTPTLEGAGTDITESYTKEDDRLGDSYVCVQSNGKALAVRFDRIGEPEYPISFFDDITEIYFYVKGYQTEDSTLIPDSNWTNLNANSDVYLSSGPNISTSLKEFRVDVETVVNKLKSNGKETYLNLLMTQGQYNKPSTWIVGTLYATRSVKLSVAKCGDVNGDGDVNILDLVRANEYLEGLVDTIPDYSFDMNDDGKIDADDLTALKKVLLFG